MKKFTAVISALLFLFVSVTASACAGGKLRAPDPRVNEEDQLVWEEVEGARGYIVSVRAADEEEWTEETVRRTSYSLASLEEGDYQIRMMSVGGSGNSLHSEWSTVLEFHKEYQTGLVYTLINGDTEYEITQAGSATGEIVIEDVYRGKPVTSIAPAAFRACGRIERITVGNNVTVIGDNAFYQCARLVSVVMPDSVLSLGTSAFQGCSALESVRLSSSLERIAENTFAYCRALKEVSLPEGLKTIGENAFYSCTSLGEVTLPASLTEIGTYAFASSSDDETLKSVSFGGGLETIGEYAFYNRRGLNALSFAEADGLTIGAHAFDSCVSLEEAELPEGLSEIGGYAFYNCGKLGSVSIPKSVTAVGEFAFNGTALYEEQTEEGIIYIGSWLVATTPAKRAEITALRAGDLRENTVGLSARVFLGCTELRSVSLPDSVKYIGEYAFYRCTKLDSFLTDPSSELESIGYAAFGEAGALRVVRLRGSAFRDIGAFAFMDCASLDNNASDPHQLVPETVEHIGQNAFYGTALYNEPKTEDGGVIYAGKWAIGYGQITQSDLVLIEDLEGVADFAFNGCDVITGVQNLGRTEHIGTGAFAGCVSLGAVSLSRSLKKIEPQTFYGCSALTTLGNSLPRTLEEIGAFAFTNCSRLAELDFTGTRVTAIDTAAFWGCSSLETLVLTDPLEEIGDYAFYMCTALTQLTLPDTLTSIGERGFGWCLMLESVDFGEGVSEIGDFAFRNCEALTSVVLPASVREVGDYAFFRCFGVTSVTLPEGLLHIGECAFSGLVGLGQIVLPASLVSIGDNAFRDCMTLGSVVMKGQIGYIGSHAFYKCFNATIYSAAAKAVSNDWSPDWNSSYRPVLWACEIDEEGAVLSVNVGEETVSNPYARYESVPPAREGYDFLGWATSPDAEEPDFAAEEWRDAEGKLYALYAAHSENE